MFIPSPVFVKILILIAYPFLLFLLCSRVIGFQNQKTHVETQRIIQLKILLNLFDDVRDKYELIEHGKLIDVYKRKKE